MKIKYKVNENVEYIFDDYEEFEKEKEKIDKEIQYYKIKSQLLELKDWLELWSK